RAAGGGGPFVHRHPRPHQRLLGEGPQDPLRHRLPGVHRAGERAAGAEDRDRGGHPRRAVPLPLPGGGGHGGEGACGAAPAGPAGGGERPLRGHPRLHHHGRERQPAGDGGDAERLLHRHGLGGVPPRGQPGQVHRRLRDGGVGSAVAAPGRRRPRAPRRAGDAGGDGGAQRAPRGGREEGDPGGHRRQHRAGGRGLHGLRGPPRVHRHRRLREHRGPAVRPGQGRRGGRHRGHRAAGGRWFRHRGAARGPGEREGEGGRDLPGGGSGRDVVAGGRMKTQTCPNCGAAHDVSIFVSGQKILCSRCGIRFEVKRNDVQPMTPGPPKRTHSGSMPTAVERPREPTKPPVPDVAPEAPGVAAPNTAAAGQDLYFDKTAIRVPGQPTPEPGGTPASGDGTAGVEVATQAPIPLTTPLVIPGFELTEILGRGGMGEVWKARQISLGRTVAIKLLPPKLAQDAEFVARFEKEATALASLSHPNVIQIIDRGVAGDHYYFVMEFVEGRSLREVMQASRLTPADALKIVAQICRAIDYAHEKHIIHRDLKPENILVDARGHVKVADFGLAGFRGHDSEKQHLTATAVAMGTLNYMAPEQRRDAKSVDGRADLYSLGVILYEMLTGELPLGRFKLPSERLAGLDLRVDEIVVKSLEPDPEQRYQRASAIGAALESIIPTSAVGISGLQPAMGSQPSGVTPRPATSQTARTGSFVERGWSWVRSALAVVGGLAVLAVVVLLVPNLREK